MTEAYELADDFAFEHVEVLTEHPARPLEAMRELRRPVPGRRHLRLVRRKVMARTTRCRPGALRDNTGRLWVGKI